MSYYLIRLLPSISLFFTICLLVRLYYARSRDVILTLLELSGIFEAAIGLLQVSGLVNSRNAIFPLTGTFDNPGPYGGYVAMILAVSVVHVLQDRAFLSINIRETLVNKDKPSTFKYVRLLIAICAAISCSLVLPATMSRTGWIAALVALATYGIRQESVRRFIRNNRLIALLTIALGLLMAVGAFALKKESALGRLHIWHIDTLALLQKPLTGWGFGNEMGAYSVVQHDYFAVSSRNDWEIRVAGCPEYPFNDYLRIGMAGGLPLLLLALAILLVALKRLNGEVLFYGFIALAIFALGSYPLSLVQFRMALALFLGMSFSSSKRSPPLTIWGLALITFLSICLFIIHIPAIKERKDAVKAVKFLAFSRHGQHYDGLADSLAAYKDLLSDDYRYLYELGLAMSKEGRYAESNEILQSGAALSSDPMFHSIMGRNLQGLGDYDSAIRKYEYASNMVPSRIYPHLLLARLYVNLGKNASALAETERAAIMAVNPRNRNMSALHEEILVLRDSLLAVNGTEHCE